jgi:hypothetical protein
MMADLLIGKQLRRDLLADEMLKWEDLQ